MNYLSIHTNIAPHYNFLVAENAYLRQAIEYRDAVLCEQQTAIHKFRSEVTQLSQKNNQLESDRERLEAEAQRWRTMKKIIRTQGGDKHVYDVQKIVDKDIERDRTREAGEIRETNLE